MVLCVCVCVRTVRVCLCVPTWMAGSVCYYASVCVYTGAKSMAKERNNEKRSIAISCYSRNFHYGVTAQTPKEMKRLLSPQPSVVLILA